MAEPDISGMGKSYTPGVSSPGFSMSMPGMENTTSELSGLNAELRNLQANLRSLSSQQSTLMHGVNQMFKGMATGASSAANAMGPLAGSSGSGGGTLPPFGSGGGGVGGGSGALSGLSAYMSDGNLVEQVARMSLLPARYAYQRFEEARGNSYGMTLGLNTTSVMSNKNLPDLMRALSGGTPLLGGLNTVLGALSGASSVGYGDLGSAKSGNYMETLRQMQMVSPQLDGSQLSATLNATLGNTQSQQRALMFTGGAMSSFGAGGAPKTLQEWAESILRFFEGQRPGSNRGKAFTREELITQQFPGSNMDAWFSTIGVQQYMREYFWQYAISKANAVGSSQGAVSFEDVMAPRDSGKNVAIERLRTSSAQSRREFAFMNTVGAGGVLSNYNNFANREGNDRKLEEALLLVDSLLSIMGSGPVGMAVSAVPSSIAGIGSEMLFNQMPRILGQIGNMFTLGSMGGVGDPGGKRRKAKVGDTYYGSYGGTTLAGLDPSFASRLSAMMADNPNITITSGFRDSVLQGKLYDAGVGMVAPPGNSYHSMGLAADLGPESEFDWIVSNASRYGLESGVGHGEPWHVGASGTVPNTVGDVKKPKIGDITDFLSGAVNMATNPTMAPGMFIGSQIVKHGDDIAGAAGSLASGDLLSMLSGVVDKLTSLFKVASKAVTGDLSALLGSGGLLDPTSMAKKVGGGIADLFGLDLSPKGLTSSLLGMLTGGIKSGGNLSQAVESSVDWSTASGGGGAGAGGGGAGAGGGGGGSWGSGSGSITARPSSVASILQKYGGGASANAANVSGSESNILQALRAASAAGLTGDELITAVAIAGRESHWNPSAFNGNRKTGDESYGLWQINMLSDGERRRKIAGVATNSGLFDPTANAKVMKSLYDTNLKRGGFYDWGPYKKKSPLYNATQYVEPVYNIAKKAGYVGDVRKASAPSNRALSGPKIQGSSESGGNTYRVVNNFDISTSGTASDAKRLARIISEEISRSVKPSDDYARG